MWTIRDLNIKNRLVIAPMAGVSNPAFRLLVAAYQPGLIYTEMVSDKALVYHNQRTLGMTQIFDEERPIALQIFGEDIDTMVKAAMFIDTQTKCDIIDINMGCPVPKIVKGSGGAALMKDIDHAAKLVEAIVKQVSKPVTVKTRLGWDEQHINVLELGQALEKAGASAIAVHGRTRAAMYSGAARFDEIAQLKQRINIPVMANGDIKTLDKALEVLDYTKADAIMIGRAVLGQPWMVEALIKGLNGEPEPSPIAIEERFTLARRHALKLIELKREDVAIKEMRGHLTWYLKGLPNSHGVKDLIAKMKSFDEFDRILKDYTAELSERTMGYESTSE
jgi:nifR3 family TIM-barrel protein